MSACCCVRSVRPVASFPFICPSCLFMCLTASVAVSPFRGLISIHFLSFASRPVMFVSQLVNFCHLSPNSYFLRLCLVSAFVSFVCCAVGFEYCVVSWAHSLPFQKDWSNIDGLIQFVRNTLFGAYAGVIACKHSAASGQCSSLAVILVFLVAGSLDVLPLLGKNSAACEKVVKTKVTKSG